MARLATLARDLTMLARGLTGRTPPPLVARAPRPSRAEPAPAPPLAAASTPTRTVVIDAITRETADAVSLTLRDPTGAPLPFTPGQFFTIEATIDGERVRRAYSASSDAREHDRATITVKRVAGGRMSTFLTERAAPGLALALLGPSGDFALPAPAATPAGAAPRHVVAIAGGSGITPIVAILRAALVDQPTTRVTLLYANRSRAAIIFADALAALVAQHGDRLRVVHHLDDEHGVPTTAAVAAHLAADVDDLLLCGPAPLMALARDAAAGVGIAASRVREERFFAPTRPTVPTTAQPVTIRRGAAIARVIVRPGDTVLEAGLAAGVPLAMSCAMGGCGACAVRLVDGAVAMDEPNCLTAAERARGTILACVARPTAPCTVEAPP